ncbi:MAG: hypothetical protein HQL73_05625 [Magnetococcales bacterium]|nr:hypothetical protein [Magnetococcales bacterium]
MKDLLKKVGKRGRCLLMAAAMAPAMSACGHVVADPTMSQMPVYDMPSAAVVRTPPVALNGGAAGAATGVPMAGMMAPSAPMAGGAYPGRNMMQTGTGAVMAMRPDGSMVIQQSPMTVQHPSMTIPQPPIWVGNPPMPIPSPPLIINQPAFSYNQSEIVVHPPNVEFVETVVLPTQVITTQPVIALPPPPPAPVVIPEKPKVTPKRHVPKKVKPVAPKEDVLPPK